MAIMLKMAYVSFIVLVFLLEQKCGIFGEEHGNRRQHRSVSSNTTAEINNNITALLDKAVSVYCSTVENIAGVIHATVKPGFVPGQTPTAQPALLPGQTPRPGPGLVDGTTLAHPPKTTIPPYAVSGGVAGTTPFSNAGYYPTAAKIFATAVNSYGSVRMVTLNNSQMHEIFQHKGGNYVRDFMAATEEEAQNFTNLLLMTKPGKISGTNSTLTAADNIVAQKTILDDLMKLQVFLSSTVKPSTTVTASVAKGMTSSANILGTKGQQPSVSPTSIRPPGTYLPKKTTTKFVQNSTSSSKPSFMSIPTANAARTTQKSQTISTVAQKAVTSVWASSTTYPTPTTYPSPPKRHSSADPVVSRSLSNLDNYLHGFNSQNGLTDLETLWKKSNTSIHPALLMELVPGSGRKKRQADGSISQEQYCDLKGSKTDDGYLHMCSTCAVITTLPDHFFPRYINEAVCKTGDSNCFVINGIAHGECRQRTITLHIMKKKTNKCLLMVHNGENIMIDDWELYPKTIRVSCECLIKKNSFLAPYVKGSLPHG